MRPGPDLTAPPAASGSDAPDESRLPAPETLKKRAEFLACARGRRVQTPAFLLQGRARTPPDDGPPRVGFTASKKVGRAVARNRARRRLREAARLVLPRHGRPGWDYVLVARRDTTATRPFAELLRDLEAALERLHAQRPGQRRPRP